MTPNLQARDRQGPRRDAQAAIRIREDSLREGREDCPFESRCTLFTGNFRTGVAPDGTWRERSSKAVLKLDPGYEKALLAIGEMQLQSGETAGAIATLEKAFDLNGASWRTHLLLASAYAKAGRLEDAEIHAARAVTLAKEKGAYATFFLGEIQDAEGKLAAAKSSWELVVTQFPNDPIATKAKEKLAQSRGAAHK